MRKVTSFIIALLGLFAVASAQLPPEVIADKYLVQAEQLLEKKDYIAALNMMDKSLALQKEHNLTLLDEFYFKYAQIAFSIGSMQAALDAVSKYLSAGREGEYYKEALALLIEIEEGLEELKELKITPENICGEKSVGSSCWMALTNQPECYVWNSDLEKDETVTWSGECSDGFAQGAGTLFWYIPQGIYIPIGIEAKGHLQRGKQYGHWIESLSRRSSPEDLGKAAGVKEGSYIHGKRHGNWVERYPEGYIYSVEKGPYVDGKRHGNWVVRTHDGREGGGPYVDGKMHGQYPGGQWEGSYVDGKRHGHWVWRGLDGTTETETYVHGHRQQ